jgi:hypothetical protein
MQAVCGVALGDRVVTLNATGVWGTDILVVVGRIWNGSYWEVDANYIYRDISILKGLRSPDYRFKKAEHDLVYQQALEWEEKSGVPQFFGLELQDDPPKLSFIEDAILKRCYADTPWDEESKTVWRCVYARHWELYETLGEQLKRV